MNWDTDGDFSGRRDFILTQNELFLKMARKLLFRVGVVNQGMAMKDGIMF